MFARSSARALRALARDESAIFMLRRGRALEGARRDEAPWSGVTTAGHLAGQDGEKALRRRAYASVRFEHVKTHRTESDLLGSMEIPSEALYGIATARAMENYHITGTTLRKYPEFIRALALTKKACAVANRKIGLLPDDVYRAISFACDELIDSEEHHHHFAVDVIQGGAGTSTNMNANEVIANLAARFLGVPIGEYSVVNPNDHVNLCQSTNDAYPSAAKLAVVLKHGIVVEALKKMIVSLRAKGDEFQGIIKMGRTQLQDAVPMTLGQEFHSFAATLEADLTFLERNVDQMYEMNLGGTAIGTSICADEAFSEEAVGGTYRSSPDFRCARRKISSRHRARRRVFCCFLTSCAASP